VSRRRPQPLRARTVRVVCTDEGRHAVSDFGQVAVIHVGDGWRADLQNATASWVRNGLLVFGFTGISESFGADMLASLLSTPGRVIDGWAVVPGGVVRAWPHLDLGSLDEGGERRLTFRPFVCHRCNRNVPLKLETLERLCIERVASGGSQLDISRIGYASPQ
jgi:hypothetical protein